ncbi:hypothetical protein CLU79DRAFT_723347 [Phycomyces nitens]|nr:hypothetical protein CLU79DRAFT_723347 [Phycomyces nitens]
MPIRRLRSFSTNSPTQSTTLLQRGLNNFIRSSRLNSQNNSADTHLTRSASHPSIHTHDSDQTNQINQTDQSNQSNQTNQTNQEQQSPDVFTPLTIKLIPNVNISGPCFIFDVIERTLEPGFTYPIGRFSDRSNVSRGISFKSKVVSRSHAQMWTVNGKLFISDTSSSSGTYLNNVRIGTPGTRSNAHEVFNGDIVQLGLDFQEGVEPMYRAVKIRVEINPPATVAMSNYSLNAFEQLQHTLNIPNSTSNGRQPDAMDQDGFLPGSSLLAREPTVMNPDANNRQSLDDISPCEEAFGQQREISTTTVFDTIQECCICLYAIAPLQALFVSPCSHVFHYRCLRPIIIKNYPAFACPICRNYYNLDSSVAVEVSDVIEAIRTRDSQNNIQTPRDITNEEDTTMPVIAEENAYSEEPMDMSIPHSDFPKPIDPIPYSNLPN